MEIKKVFKGCIQVDFSSQEELCKTFIRFQEYYESPEFKDKIFTLGQYKQWYSEQYGAFTYYEDWNGFNIPGWVFLPFVQGLFDPLTKQEQLLLDKVQYHSLDSLYVIGTHSGGDDGTLIHELRHAKFSLNSKYKESVLREIDLNKNHTVHLEDWIINKGYNIGVLKDEVNAYLSDLDHLEDEGIDIKNLIHLAKSLDGINKGYK